MSQTLKYAGDLRNVDLSSIIGKDRDGRRVAARSVTYDEASDTSTVTLRGIPPAEYRELIEPLIQQGVDRERLRGLFGA